MSDLITRARAKAYLTENADRIESNVAAKMRDAEYAQGFIAGYRAAAESVGNMLTDDVQAMLDAMKAEAAA